MTPEEFTDLCVQATTIPSLEAGTALSVLLDHLLETPAHIPGHVTSKHARSPELVRLRMLAGAFIYAWRHLGCNIYQLPPRRKKLSKSQCRVVLPPPQPIVPEFTFFEAPRVSTALSKDELQAIGRLLRGP